MEHVVQGKEKYYRITEYLLSPHPYRNVKDADRRYSQARQDEIVFDIVKKRGGFFIDMGANNGQFLSNSLWLERHHNWTGLLIEADPELCQRMINSNDTRGRYAAASVKKIKQ